MRTTNWKVHVPMSLDVVVCGASVIRKKHLQSLLHGAKSLDAPFVSHFECKTLQCRHVSDSSKPLEYFFNTPTHWRAFSLARECKLKI